MRHFIVLGLLFCFTVFTVEASAVKGFDQRFQLVKNDQGQVLAIRLKTANLSFSLRPYLEQIKNDLLREQATWRKKGDTYKIREIDSTLRQLGLDSKNSKLAGSNDHIRDSLIGIPNISVERSFDKLNANGFMREFEAKIKEALLQVDLAVLCHLNDSSYFYKRKVLYQVVTWALNEAKKRFSEVPILNLASFVIVKVHDLLYEQKTFHHNMLLHYFENVKETELGMTKKEVDRAISSIYEYRIQASGFFESRNAQANWEKYGWNLFYRSFRQGTNRERQLSSGAGPLVLKKEERINFAFSTFNDQKSKKIYHLLHNAHQFTSKPALAYDYGEPNKVRRTRALLNLAQVGLGFLPLPNWIKENADSIIKSFYLEQSRVEGALVAFFELQGLEEMKNQFYLQSNNPYLLY